MSKPKNKDDSRTKYMNGNKQLSIIVIFLFFIIPFLSAQEIEFIASVKPFVGLGENFNLTYTINAQAISFKGPNLSNFSVLSGPSTSTTSSIRSVNGRTSMSITYTFSYILQASKEGTFDIQPASVTVDRKSYESNPVTVKVVKNASGNQQGQSPNTFPQSRNPQQRSGVAETGSNDVLLKAFVTSANPYQGEGIVVTYKLFFKVNIGNVNITKFSSFPGFWSQNLISETDKMQPYKQMIDGEQYVVVDIRKIVLFPLKTGRLTIDPLELVCVAEIKRQTKTKTGDPFFDDFFNDSFFNNSYATVEKSLKSNPLVINVKPLPISDKPADFNGAVGNFSFRSEIDKTRLKTNEPITLKFIVSGQGNIQLIDKMNITFPPDFETYDPKITSDIKSAPSGISGSQTFEYLMIPRKPGRFNIKPVTFSYFDLSKQKYVQISSPQYSIDVEKGIGDATSLTYSGASKEDIKYIGSDIRHIKNQPLSLRKTGTLFFNSTLFYLWIFLPLLAFIVLVVFWRKRRERHANTLLMKNRKATKIARKRLKKADHFLKSNKQERFYEEISLALWGYLSDKFGISLAELSMDSVHEALVNKNVEEEIINQFTETLNNTDYARFAPGDKSLMMGKIYNEALELISKIERGLR
jgi:BatD DUF11 like domain